MMTSNACLTPFGKTDISSIKIEEYLNIQKNIASCLTPMSQLNILILENCHIPTKVWDSASETLDSFLHEFIKFQTQNFYTCKR